MGKLTLEQNEIRNTMQFERQLISMSPLLYWDLRLGPSLPALLLLSGPQSISVLRVEDWRSLLCFQDTSFLLPTTESKKSPFLWGENPATPYVDELIVFSTSLQEEGSLKRNDLSSGRFLKMLKRYPQFQGYRLLWFLVKFTRSESAGAWRSQLGRRHRGWVGGWVGGSQEMSTGLADTLHKRLSHGCQLQELFLLGPELSFLSIFMDRIMAPLQKFTPPIALWSQRGRCMGTGSPLLSEVTSTWSLPQSKWRESDKGEHLHVTPYIYMVLLSVFNTPILCGIVTF